MTPGVILWVSLESEIKYYKGPLNWEQSEEMSTTQTY